MTAFAHWAAILTAFAADPQPIQPIAANRTWDRIALADDRRDMLRQAGERLGDWRVMVAGRAVDGPWLVALADERPDEPILRVARESMRQAVDLDDLLRFLDDVLVAGDAGRRGEPFVVPAGRARSEGLLLHPDDIFEKDEPREYPRGRTVAVDAPAEQAVYEPAADGAILGPEWTRRYVDPSEPAEMWRTLAEARPTSGFASRVASLVAQLEQQGADVYLNSFMRHRERGYLMWGASLLRNCKSQSCVDQAVVKLTDRNRRWELEVPIVWRHPDGWRATIEAARRMADAYGVVFATEKGAYDSWHYEGKSVDFVAVGLPARLELWAPDGAFQVFDLAAPEASRDLSLSPELITWIDEHYGFRKLEPDYPHWDDMR